jgi:DNA mismatch endonuclease Vsr
MDKLTKEQRRKNMQAVKSSGSKIETLFGKCLWAKGFRYRKNDKTVFGKPDFVLKKYKVAIFCDSEFWHGKNWNKKKHEHKSNIDFWHKKISGNIQRDKTVNRQLTKEGWLVLRFWGKEIEKNSLLCISKVEQAIKWQRKKLKQ